MRAVGRQMVKIQFRLLYRVIVWWVQVEKLVGFAGGLDNKAILLRLESSNSKSLNYCDSTTILIIITEVTHLAYML